MHAAQFISVFGQNVQTYLQIPLITFSNITIYLFIALEIEDPQKHVTDPVPLDLKPIVIMFYTTYKQASL